MSEIIDITAEMTPNPNTLKFNVNRELCQSGSMNFPDAAKAKGAPIEPIFEIPNVLGVMVGRDFITVTKKPEAPWQPMVEPLIAKMREVIAAKGVLFTAPGGTGGNDANNEVEAKIRAILDNEIRPAVAMDGGDILFHGYKDGVVTLYLQGSCSSCPSSIMTLKMGVENRLKSLIPEIREVVQV